MKVNNTVKYFEFNNHEYYALLAIESGCSDDITYELFSNHIADMNIEGVEVSGRYNQITKDEALLKFIMSGKKEGLPVNKLIKQFENARNMPILIDSP